MPRIIETTASGSPIPDSLTQSPRTPFTVGKIQMEGDIIFGYSGAVNFDLTLSATYPLLSFTLERSAILKAQFSCDYDLIANSGSAVGWQISIDGIVVSLITGDWSSGNTYGFGRVEKDFYLPSGRNCDIVVMNPDGQGDLLQANCTLVGQFL